MTTLKIRAEADSLEELNHVVEHLRKEYGIVKVNMPHGEEGRTKAWIQNIEAIKNFQAEKLTGE